MSPVYLCQFVADVAFRRCSIRYRTVLESRCSLKHRIWSDAQRVGMPAFTGTLHQSERLLQASEWVASWTTYGLLLDVSKGCVRLLTDQITVVASLTPRQIDRGDVKWPYTLRQKQGSTEAGSVGKEEHDSSVSYSQYITVYEHKSSIFKIKSDMNSKNRQSPQQASRSKYHSSCGDDFPLHHILMLEPQCSLSSFAQREIWK